MDGCAGGSLGFCEKVNFYFLFVFKYRINQAKYNNDELQWSCSTTHVLWAENANKASPTPIKCEKLNFKVSALSKHVFFLSTITMIFRATPLRFLAQVLQRKKQFPAFRVSLRLIKIKLNKFDFSLSRGILRNSCLRNR